MAENMLTIDSKFRRETSNFKVDFDTSSVTPLSQDPVLIKYIEKNLKPEELLGLVVAQSGPGPSAYSTIIDVYQQTGEEDTDFVYYVLATLSSGNGLLYYVPSTGALSLNGPYVETEEGGETGESVIDAGDLPINPAPLDPTY